LEPVALLNGKDWLLSCNGIKAVIGPVASYYLIEVGQIDPIATAVNASLFVSHFMLSLMICVDVMIYRLRCASFLKKMVGRFLLYRNWGTPYETWDFFNKHASIDYGCIVYSVSDQHNMLKGSLVL
jgi:hypothetical protein